MGCGKVCTEGCGIGNKLGLDDGKGEGCNEDVGWGERMALGESVRRLKGSGVGCGEGCMEGCGIGIKLGLDVWIGEGCFVCSSLTSVLGFSAGEFEGKYEGDFCENNSCNILLEFK